MAAPDFALAHAAQRKQLADMVAAVGWRLWSKVDRRNISSSWMGLLASLIEIMTGTQKVAAAAAEPFTAAATAGAVAEGVVAAGSFAGMASDGRNLVSLLFQPVITALDAIKRGASVDEAMVLGGTQLEMINRTQVADAGRTADQVALIARPEADGYIRIVVGDTCSRCIILAGRWYSYSEWFERHPNCDCIMLPAPQAEAAGLVQDPRAIYEGLNRRQRTEAGWTRAEQEAIDEGADIIAVTNARRGVYTAGGKQYTREGTTRRGVYGGYTVDPETGALRRRPRGQRAAPRLTPQQIFDDAKDRDDAIRLLREYGYLLGPATERAEPEQDSKPATAITGKEPQKLRVLVSELGKLGEDELRQRLTAQFVEVRGMLRKRPDLTDDLDALERGVDGSFSRGDLLTSLLYLARQLELDPGQTDTGSVPGADQIRSFARLPSEVTIGDLLPHDGEWTPEKNAAIVDALERRINGTYAGLHVTIEETDILENALSFTAEIRDDDGHLVGGTERLFQREFKDGREVLFVYHALLQLDPEVQGQGFSKAWNGHLQKWYEESRLEYIEVTANIDVGGYTWARAGFDFADMKQATKIAERLKRDLETNAANYDTGQLAAAERMLERLAGDFGSADFPTAYEVSQTGRKSGQSKVDGWPGKNAMLGSTWKGLKPVAAKPVEVAPAPDYAEQLRRFAERVQQPELSRVQLSGGIMGKTYLVTLRDGTKVIHKVARKYEGVPARDQQDAEELVPWVLQSFGLRGPLVQRASANSIYMEYFDGDVAVNLTDSRRAEFYDSDEGRILGLVDALMANRDRSDANWIAGRDGSLLPIDHGIAHEWSAGPLEELAPEDGGFGKYLVERAKIPFERDGKVGYFVQWIDNDLSPGDIETARSRLAATRPQFERLGRLDWYDNAVTRLNLIGRYATGTRVRLT